MFTYESLLQDPSALAIYKGRDPVPLVCSRCGKVFPRLKDQVRPERLQEKMGLYCTISCSRKHPYEKSLSIIGGVTGRICQVCAEWKPLTKYIRGKDPTCNTCWGKKPARRLYDYKTKAAERGVPFALTDEEFFSFWQTPCHYCGSPNDTIGLDRVDGNLGYCLSNIVPACTRCNIGRNTLTQGVFLEHCRRVAERHHRSSPALIR